MRQSPARAHWERQQAASVESTAPSGGPREATHQLLQARLLEDRRRLKEIQSVERKVEVKQEMLPTYEAWIEGVLEADSGTPDEVFMTMLVWFVDCGLHERALVLAEHALRHGMALPDQYKRDVATFVAEEIAEAALRPGATVPPSTLKRLDEITGSHDMPDEVRAKVFKALGTALEEGDPINALAAYQRALQLHDRVGVKKDIEKLEVRIKNSTPAK